MTTSNDDDGLPFIASEDLPDADIRDIDAIRRQSPVVRVAPNRVMALRLEDTQRLCGDPALIQLPGAQYTAAFGIPKGRCTAFLESFMLMSNGPDHQRRRGAFQRTFAHPVIRSKRDHVREVADRIVADLPRGEPFDFLDLCASRLPAEVIAEVLGLPTDQSRWFAHQVYSFSRCLMVPYALPAHDEIEASAEALYQFVDEALESRRADPRDDLLSKLANDDSARALDRDELTYQVMGVILAGSDTTRSGFNMVVARLLGDRQLWDRVMADRGLIPAAIEESLRIEPPVGSFPRFAPGPVDIGGVKVAGGQVVALASITAMRDDASLKNAEEFDLTRDDQVRPHLVFGGGAHRCLGEMLARIEMEEGLAALMDGAPDIQIVETSKMLGYGGIRKSTPLIARIG